MDDTKTVKVKFKGVEYDARPLAEHQVAMLALAYQSKSQRTMSRILRSLIEHSFGDDMWDDLLVGIAEGKHEESDLTNMIVAVIQAEQAGDGA